MREGVKGRGVIGGLGRRWELRARRGDVGTCGCGRTVRSAGGANGWGHGISERESVGCGGRWIWGGQKRLDLA